MNPAMWGKVASAEEADVDGALAHGPNKPRGPSRGQGGDRGVLKVERLQEPLEPPVRDIRFQQLLFLPLEVPVQRIEELKHEPRNAITNLLGV